MNQPQPLALLFPEIKELLGQKEYVLLKQIIRECNSVDFADVWKRFTDDEKVQLFRLLSAASALKLFEILEVNDQKLLLERSSDESVFPILEGMDFGLRAAFCGKTRTGRKRLWHWENQDAPQIKNERGRSYILIGRFMFWKWVYALGDKASRA